MKIDIKTDKLFTNINHLVESVIPNDFNGLAHIYCPHSTAALFILEEELLHLVDVRFFLDKLVPFKKLEEGEQRNIKYLHDLISLRGDVPADERVNGHSHIRSLFFNTSEIVPVTNGKLQTGQYQRLFFIELDPIRSRHLFVSCLEATS